MRQDRALLLADLLRETREQDQGYFPDEAWLEIHKSFAIPYVELVLPRYSAEGNMECFLARREEADPYWPGRPWHIPGGIWRATDTRDEACNAAALRELRVPVTCLSEVMTYKWSDHPYANAISHLCICQPARLPVETPAARFCSMTELPQPMLLHHTEFLETCRRYLVSGKDN